MEFQIATLKAMGSTAFRTAHNPVAPELLHYCDKYGMLVWEENRFITHGVQPLAEPANEPHPEPADGRVDIRERRFADRRGGKGWGSHWDKVADPPYINPTGIQADPVLLQDAQDMVLRDRNHACIVIWSLCNELGCVTNDENGGDIAVQFKQAIQSADASRPITGNTVQAHFFHGRGCNCSDGNFSHSAECANCRKLTDKFADAMDVQSFSYEYDVWSQFHQTTPWKAVGGGESASCTTDRGYFDADAHSPGHTCGTCAGHRDGTIDEQERLKSNHLSNLFDCIKASWIDVATQEFVFGNFA